MPRRIQRKRTKGWQMPEGAVYVGRPTKWGNPFTWQGEWITWAAVALGFRADPPGRKAAAVALYRQWMTGQTTEGPLVGDKTGGVFGYSDGTERTVHDHCRGLAGALTGLCKDAPSLGERPGIEELRGKDLVCWCPLDQPCHADVLLEIANSERRE